MAASELTPEEREERYHFQKVLAALRHYSRDAGERLSRCHANLRKLPLAHQKLLTKHGFRDHLQAIDSCVELNQSILSAIISDASNLFENSTVSESMNTCPQYNKSSWSEKASFTERTNPMDVDKVHSTLKQFMRDWSEDGAEERRLSYKPILDELQEIYTTPRERDSSEIEGEQNRLQHTRLADIKILVPGAGLGRLAYDIARMGFSCQGNEFSLYMLLASNYVLNKCHHVNAHTVYPWIHQFTNILSSEDATRPVHFPDVEPSRLPEGAKFSMVAGDFLEVYSDPEHVGSLDVVVTCFFLDCAHNVLDFIELIRKILKPEGRWINLGPLLYHFADVPKESSIEPSYDVVRQIIIDSGFTFVKEETDLPATYCQNVKSMLQYRYSCVFFSCVKRDAVGNGDGSS